jgi:hypothetical protein
MKGRTMSNRAERITAMFGGVMEMHRATGIDPATISRFAAGGKRGYHGMIPARFNNRILAGARKRKLDAKAILANLSPNACPCCDRPLEPGQEISNSKLRTAIKAYAS